MLELGRVDAIYRYPVKSMAGESLAAAQLGWYGIDGDRRFAVRRIDATGGMPWLTASRLHELLRFTPICRGGELPTHVRTPEGDELPIASRDMRPASSTAEGRCGSIDGDALAAELARRHGHPVELMRLDRGIFDETPVSLITPATIATIAGACGHAPDARRYRPNVVIAADGARAFDEDRWVGGIVVFGDGDAEVCVAMRDERCAILNLDPDSARSDPEVMKTVVRMNANTAGVYATVIRCGRIAVGQRVRLDQSRAR